MFRDAVQLCRSAGYENAGTVEFLLDTHTGKYYFIEVNPRVQVEHTVTEEVTGVDIVQTQIKIAAGMTLPQLGLTQESIHVNGYAVQCRITTEDPARGFQPDSGIISVYRSATGNGIRLDDGPGYSGAPITPHYDSLLVKVTARAASFDNAVAKLTRALREHRIRGVTTNIPFLLNMLRHPAFLRGAVTTRFIEEHPEVLRAQADTQNRGEKVLRYLSNVAVNGPDPALGATGTPSLLESPVIPALPLPASDPRVLAVKTPLAKALATGNASAAIAAPVRKPYLRDVFIKQGPKAFAKAVRAHPRTLLMDTTWRDAHQSLLATRVRTVDLLNIAPATREALAPAYALENWGGATFDVAMRFLRECPWDRLDAMREQVPDIPFQMLLRGANAVGYTSYPDNAVHKFCDVAVRHGMDVFRVFDSLNYIDNLKLGIDAVGAAGGVVEAAVCYTGDVFSGEVGARGADYKYKLDYYLALARQLVESGTHVLAIKDMAGLLTPQSARMLVGALRKEFPDLPIHVHTHDTAGTGVASMVAAIEAGADVVDTATDAVSGSTSQPSMGALVAALAGTPHATDLDPKQLNAINDYWEECRQVYSPFESGQLTGSADVYQHEIPGGQFTNLLFQSKQLGLAGQFALIKHAYTAANRILGDIIKVTPSSKVVGDLAQFMVANRLSEQQVLDQAETLSFPQSVVEFLQGTLGIPHGGFPEPFRSRVLRGRKLPNGKDCFVGRPGAELPDTDFPKVERALRERYGETVREVDTLSYVMYPAVFDDWMKFTNRFGDVSVLPTHEFVSPMKIGQEIQFPIQKGKTLFIRLKAISEVDDTGHREVIWELNGEHRVVRVADHLAGVKVTTRSKADKNDVRHVGAPMPGVVIDVRVAPGKVVKAGQPLCVLSAMKMETVVAAPRAGTVKEVSIAAGDTLEAGDLVVVIE
jgi:pyruvate carboxylase